MTCRCQDASARGKLHYYLPEVSLFDGAGSLASIEALAPAQDLNKCEREPYGYVGSLKESVSFGMITERPSIENKKVLRFERWVELSRVWIVPPPGSSCCTKTSDRV